MELVGEIRALIVDDSVAMREAMRELVRSLEGCVVVGEGANGVEALELARALRPSLVVMDVHMPVLGGLEAMRRLLREAPGTPVVLVTSALEPEVREAALRYGAVAILEKGSELWAGLSAIVAQLLCGPAAAVPRKIG
ncbi:MAG: response regulator [Chloroflexi bacterium]|nr:response regulator [Chloroflexota bacterium]